MFNIGPGELIVILLIVLVLFGPKRLPEIGHALGRAIQEFKKAGKAAQDNVKEITKEEQHKT